MWGLCMIFQCCKDVHREKRELQILKEIVLIRTEGLCLIEKLEQVTDDSAILLYCAEAKRYYTLTQPHLVDMCRHKPLGLQQEDYTEIMTKLEREDTVQKSYISLYLLAHYSSLIDQHIVYYTEYQQEHLALDPNDFIGHTLALLKELKYKSTILMNHKAYTDDENSGI